MGALGSSGARSGDPDIGDAALASDSERAACPAPPPHSRACWPPSLDRGVLPPVLLFQLVHATLRARGVWHHRHASCRESAAKVTPTGRRGYSAGSLPQHRAPPRSPVLPVECRRRCCWLREQCFYSNKSAQMGPRTGPQIDRRPENKVAVPRAAVPWPSLRP